MRKTSKNPMEKVNLEQLKSRLLLILKEKSYEKKEVTLSSGQKSDFYIDCRQTTLHPEGAFLVGEVIYNMVKELDVNGIGGPTMGADPMVASVSLVSYMEGRPLPAFIIRKAPKKHGLGLWIEGKKNLKDGDRVVILEDVVTTGTSAIIAAEKAKEEGLKVAAIISLVDRIEGGAETIEKAGYDYMAVFTKTDILSLRR